MRKGTHMGETIRDVMTPSPRTVESTATAADAARPMRDEDVGLVPVVESDRVTGTVMDGDIAVASPASPPGSSSRSIRVGRSTRRCGRRRSIECVGFRSSKRTESSSESTRKRTLRGVQRPDKTGDVVEEISK